MAELQQYKCPCCGGAVEFNSQLQKMKCPYCDTEFEMETLKEYEQELQGDDESSVQWEKQEGNAWQEQEKQQLRSYICSSCGGEILTDATTAASFCPYCDNPVVMTQQVSGDLRPDFVIPFKMDKNAAKQGLKKHFSGKRLLPKVFKDENHLDEVKGVYVPFWLFDADTETQLRCRATRVRTWSDRDYRYTETQYFAVYRGGTMGFQKVPVDGSSKMAADLMQSLEPYDFGEAVDFQTAYLSGYLADRYDVGAKESAETANERIRASARQAFMNTITGYSSVIPEEAHVHLSGGKARYALFPVWLLNTTWNGQKYTFAMNGQTGKFVGNLPMDKKAAFRWALGVTAAVTALAYGGAWLLWLLGVL